MLTARAEYRLRLRADNAETRLTPAAVAAGCVSARRLARFERRQGERATAHRLLARRRTGAELRAAGVAIGDAGPSRPLGEWLRFPELNSGALIAVEPAFAALDPAILEEAVEDHRYAPYVTRQEAEILRLSRDEALRIPPDFDYASVPGLSNEMIERLAAARPTDLGAARRIRGITPAALAAILVQCRRKAAWWTKPL
jgi:tRNA uridine 5-carboxymethylaminomethyl modification enzyme